MLSHRCFSSHSFSLRDELLQLVLRRLHRVDSLLRACDTILEPAFCRSLLISLHIVGLVSLIGQVLDERMAQVTVKCHDQVIGSISVLTLLDLEQLLHEAVLLGKLIEALELTAFYASL